MIGNEHVQRVEVEELVRHKWVKSLLFCLHFFKMIFQSFINPITVDSCYLEFQGTF